MPKKDETAGKRVGIVEVAARAGVSVTTVSHALSGRRPVAAATREHIAQVISELGYRPNELARSMRRQRTSTIALLVPDITNPFYPGIARGLLDVITPAGYHGIISNTDGDQDTERELVEEMVTRRVDALAIAAHAAHLDDLKPAVAAGIPVVLLGWHETAAGVDVIGGGDVEAGVTATDHLIERGYRRIAFLCGPFAEDMSHPRIHGFRASFGAHSIPVRDDLVVTSAPGRDGGAAGLAQLLDRSDPPDAVLCINDITAIGALDTARERNLRVPQDVAIMGFDDVEAAALVSPALTTIAHPIRDQGRTVGRLLLQRLSQDQPEAPQKIILPVQLIVRETT